MYERILVATDGSALSKKATHEAIRLARLLGSRLVVLHVVPRYPTSYLEGAIGISRREQVRTEKQWREKGQEMVDAVADTAQRLGVTARGLVVQSNVAADAILRAAKKRDCDLVVMASHGRKGVKRVLMGSETQHVLTHGSVPTLVLR